MPSCSPCSFPAERRARRTAVPQRRRPARARSCHVVAPLRLFAPSTHEPFSSNDDATDDTASDSIERVVPWIVVGHSVGSWCAFEFVRLARSLGFPPPALACLSGFPAPDVPTRQRPWTPNKGLDDAAFKDECRGWGVDEAVFAPHAWRVFEPTLRADFTLFDAYTYEMDVRGTESDSEDRKTRRREDSAQPADDRRSEDVRRVFPRLLTLRGTRDERVTRELVSDWARFTRGPVDSRGARGGGCLRGFRVRHVELEGAAHLVLTQPAHKTAWLRAVADALETVPRNA